MQLRGGEVRVVDRQRRRVRTAQHHRYVQFLHQVELALGAVEAALELRLGHAFEIAEWLIQVDGQAQIGHHRPHLRSRAPVVDEVVFEEFDAVEARGRDGLELFGQRPAE